MAQTSPLVLRSGVSEVEGVCEGWLEAASLPVGVEEEEQPTPSIAHKSTDELEDGG